MQFTHYNFCCAVDVFKKDDDIIARFYDAAKEHGTGEIHDLVIVDAGYGYLCLKFKDDDGLLSGCLDEFVFATDDIVEAAIEFVESLSPKSAFAYIPHHVDRVRKISYVEYNGE